MDGTDAVHTNISQGIWNITSSCINGANKDALGSGFEPLIHYTILVLYGLLITAAVLLNIAICYIYYMRYVRQNTFNLLIVSLSVADLTSAIGLLPFVGVTPIMLRHSESDDTRDVLCGFTFGKGVFFIGACISIVLVTWISIHRYVCISLPTSSLVRVARRKSTGYFVTVIAWLIGIVIALPVAFGWQYKDCHATCRWTGIHILSTRVYVLVTAVIFFGVPFCTMFMTFVASLQKFCCNQSRADIFVRAKKQKIVKQLLAVLILFISSWAPIWIYGLMAKFSGTMLISDDVAGYYKNARILYVLTIFTLLPAAFNPLLYGLKSPEFRKAVSYRLRTTAANENSEASPLIS